MAELKINGKTYEARTDFKFQRKADDKYTQKDAKGNELGGFRRIYGSLLEKDVLHLAYFWDCALSHLKERPSLDEIEEALYESAGEEQNYEPLFKDAFQKLDNAGFFSEQVKNFWKETDMMLNYVENDEEEKDNIEMYKAEVERLKETRKQLNTSTTKK